MFGPMSNSTKAYSRTAFITLISVFFFWGFVAASNTILIPIFKKHFHLLQWQSQLVDSAFYAAYFIGSLIYFLLSVSGNDILNRIGYKKGLVIGLGISALGALGFVPAAQMESFPLMLTSLFIVAMGFSLQQIVANPYVIALGSPATGAHRVSLAGGINSFGTTIGPLLLSFVLFGSIKVADDAVFELSSVQMPYTVLALAFVAFALFIAYSALPPVTHEETSANDFKAFSFPQVILGMIAIFVYVGTEVTIQSNLPELMRQPEFLGLDSKFTVHFISLYWGSLMIGRWTGATGAFNLKGNQKTFARILAPLAAYVVILAVNYIKGSPMSDLYSYFPLVVLIIIGFIITNDKPARIMMVFGTAAAVMMLAGLLTHGYTALYCFISGGLFCSVMWPCIFSLSLAGLGKYTNQASALLIMMILGGAVLPPLQGFLADKMSIHTSYIVPLLGFLYLAFFGYKVQAELGKQGISYDEELTAH